MPLINSRVNGYVRKDAKYLSRQIYLNMELDFSRLDVFTSTKNKQVELALRIDDILDGNERFVPSFELMDNKELGLKSNDNVSFRKVIKSIRDYLRSIGGNLEEEKQGKYTAYRYALAHYNLSYPNRSPFIGHRKVTKKVSLNDTISRLKDIIEFLPESVQSDYFSDTEILVSNEMAKKNGKHYIAPESNSLLSGIKFLPELYKAIANQTVLLVSYSKGYNYEVNEEFHPHFLKEYNGRWYVCGRTVSLEDQSKFRDDALLALDRIIDIDEANDSSHFHKCNPGHYDTFFDNIIGVTHDQRWGLEEVIIKIHDRYVFNLLKTKKLHSSQTEIEDSDNLIIRLKVCPNRELTTKLLSFGYNVEVVAPIEYRDFFAGEVHKISQLYK